MKIFLIIVIFLLFGLIISGIYLGLFSSVEINEEVRGPLKLIYQEYKGPYQDTKKIQDEIYYSLLNNENIETYRGFGIYYDDPKTTVDSELRSKSGCILEEKDYNKIDQLVDDYNLMELERQKFISVEFAFKSRLSIMVGIFKIYPKIEDYIKEKGYKKREVMEIYDMPNKKIIYLMPIEDSFK